MVAFHLAYAGKKCKPVSAKHRNLWYRPPLSRHAAHCLKIHTSPRIPEQTRGVCFVRSNLQAGRDAYICPSLHSFRQKQALQPAPTTSTQSTSRYPPAKAHAIGLGFLTPDCPAEPARSWLSKVSMAADSPSEATWAASTRLEGSSCRPRERPPQLAHTDGTGTEAAALAGARPHRPSGGVAPRPLHRRPEFLPAVQGGEQQRWLHKLSCHFRCHALANGARTQQEALPSRPPCLYV